MVGKVEEYLGAFVVDGIVVIVGVLKGMTGGRELSSSFSGGFDDEWEDCGGDVASIHEALVECF